VKQAEELSQLESQYGFQTVRMSVKKSEDARKLVFTGKATQPKEFASNAEVKKAVAADPKAIGYIDKSAVDDTVKVILTLP